MQYPNACMHMHFKNSATNGPCLNMVRRFTANIQGNIVQGNSFFYNKKGLLFNMQLPMGNLGQRLLYRVYKKNATT